MNGRGKSGSARPHSMNCRDRYADPLGYLPYRQHLRLHRRDPRAKRKSAPPLPRIAPAVLRRVGLVRRAPIGSGRASSGSKAINSDRPGSTPRAKPAHVAVMWSGTRPQACITGTRELEHVRPCVAPRGDGCRPRERYRLPRRGTRPRFPLAQSAEARPRPVRHHPDAQLAEDARQLRPDDGFPPEAREDQARRVPKLLSSREDRESGTGERDTMLPPALHALSGHHPRRALDVDLIPPGAEDLRGAAGSQAKELESEGQRPVIAPGPEPARSPRQAPHAGLLCG